MKDLSEKYESLENTIINLNEALTGARKEIIRLQGENGVETERANNYYEMYQNLCLEKERRESAMSSEINELKNQLRYIGLEKDQLSKMLKVQNVNDDRMSSKKKYFIIKFRRFPYSSNVDLYFCNSSFK